MKKRWQRLELLRHLKADDRSVSPLWARQMPIHQDTMAHH